MPLSHDRCVVTIGLLCYGRVMTMRFTCDYHVIAGEFQPKHAAIVKDKDELRVPLSLATLPTPKVCGQYAIATL